MASQTVTQPFEAYQRALEPYIKPRSEVARMRRELACHLSSHVQQSQRLSRPLSLLEASLSIKNAPHGIRGIQKEYLRCVKANIESRSEYTSLHRIQQSGHADHIATSDVAPHGHNTPDVELESFLHLIKTRHRHERLRIIQGSAATLTQGPAASQNNFDPTIVLQDIGSMPQVPSVIVDEVFAKISRESTLKSLVEQLERSVLRAKMLLKKEQKLLAKIQKTGASSSATQKKKVQALGTTRNELINWIEGELARSGEDSSETLVHQDHADGVSNRERGKPPQLASIQALYLLYSKSRGALARAVSDNVIASGALDSNRETTILPESETLGPQTTPINSVHQHLVGFESLSNQQKAALQQRGHLTTTLAKQFKDTDRNLDRLANESHLLTAHPETTARSHIHQVGGNKSFEDEISGEEIFDTSRKAKDWLFAADGFGLRSSRTISENLEDGGSAILEAQETLLTLLGFLGNDNDDGWEDSTTLNDRIETGSSGDIWAVLNGKLGVI